MNKRVGFFTNGYDPEGNITTGKNDISKIYQILIDEKYGQCDRNLSEMNDNVKSKKDFTNLLDDFLNKLEINNQLIFYFSGHGEYDGETFYLKFSQDRYSFDTFLSELKSYKIHKAIIILDACFSGAAISGLKSSNSGIIKNIPEGIAILTSSTELQTSHEKEDGTFSLFTHLLCDCIETGYGGEATHNNEITISDIAKYARQHNKENGQIPKWNVTNADGSIWIAKNITPSIKEVINKEIKTSIMTEAEKIDYKMATFTEKTNSEIKIEDLDWNLITEYTEKTNEETYRIDVSSSKHKILNQLGFYKHGMLINAVVLNFAKKPDIFISQSYIIISIDKKSRKEIYGSNIDLLNKSLKYISNNINDYSYFDKETGKRIDDYVVPKKILREALSNALTHRCFENCHDPIKINISKENNQIEIKSPGNFLGNCKGMIEDDNNDFSSLRDARMGKYIMTLGVAEGHGRGFNHFRVHNKKHGKDKIIFNNDDNFTKIILKFIENKNTTHYNYDNIHIIPKILTTTLTFNFIGREKELSEIEKYLNETNSTVIINGIGGIGKSTLASQYFYKNKKEFDYYGYISVFDDIKSSIVLALKSSLNLQSKTIDEDFSDAIIKLQNLQGKKLLVIDDIKDVEKQNEIIKIIQGLTSSNWKILLTSREMIENTTLYELDRLSLEDARELFIYHFKTIDIEKVDAILNYLDRHTLFVELTAKSLKKDKDTTLDNLLEMFKNGKLPEVQVNRKESFDDYLVKRFSLDNLDSKQELILKKLSLMPSIEIEFEILNAFFDIEDLSWILEELKEKGWLSADDRSYKMHQIIKEFILNSHAMEYEDIKDVIDYFNTALKNSNDPQTAVDNKKNILYFESITDFLLQKGIKNKIITALLRNIATIYYHLGNYKRALYLYEKTLNARLELFNKNSAEVAQSYDDLAKIYKVTNNNKNALQLYEKALKIKQDIFGENSLNVAQSYDNLAKSYSYEKALAYFTKSLNIREELLDKDDSIIATSYINIADIYKSMDIYEKALPLYEKALKIRSYTLGDMHPDTIFTYNKIAEFYSLINEYKKAMPLYKKTLENSQIILGIKHPLTATCYYNLADLYKKSNQQEDALLYYKKSFDIRKEIFGKQHTKTLESYNSIIKLQAAKIRVLINQDNKLDFLDKMNKFHIKNCSLLEINNKSIENIKSIIQYDDLIIIPIYYDEDINNHIIQAVIKIAEEYGIYVIKLELNSNQKDNDLIQTKIIDTTLINIPTKIDFKSKNEKEIISYKNNLFLQTIKDISEFISYEQEGMSIDFTDFKAVLGDKSHAEINSFIYRDEKIHNIFSNNIKLNNIDGIMVNFYINKNYPFTNIQNIMDKIYDQSNKDADVILGINTDLTMKDNEIRIILITVKNTNQIILNKSTIDFFNNKKDLTVEPLLNDIAEEANYKYEETNEVVIQFLPAVRAMSFRLKDRLPSSIVDVNDLLAIGIEEMVKLSRQYDMSQNDSFWGYAKRRVYGSMLDSLRSLDIVSKSNRRLINEIEVIANKYLIEHSSEPSEKFLAEQLGEPIARIREAKTAVEIANHLPLIEQIMATPKESVEEKVEQDQLIEAVKAILTTLSDREQTIIQLYYFEEKNLMEISQILNISESRISQLHKKLMRQIKAKLTI